MSLIVNPNSVIDYKFFERGLSVIGVDARKPSTTCPVCGFASKSNRVNRDMFKCGKCGLWVGVIASSLFPHIPLGFSSPLGEFRGIPDPPHLEVPEVHVHGRELLPTRLETALTTFEHPAPK